MTEDFGALESPAVEASPPKLQILCLAALSKEVNSSTFSPGGYRRLSQIKTESKSHKISLHGVKMADLGGHTHAERHQKSLRFQVIETKNTVRPSEKNVGCQRETVNGLGEDVQLLESLKLCAQEDAKWSGVAELKEQKDMFENFNTSGNRLRMMERASYQRRQTVPKAINWLALLVKDYMLMATEN